eukprot:2723231-Pyramimonas_sp.AAC.1
MVASPLLEITRGMDGDASAASLDSNVNQVPTVEADIRAGVPDEREAADHPAEAPVPLPGAGELPLRGGVGHGSPGRVQVPPDEEAEPQGDASGRRDED